MAWWRRLGAGALDLLPLSEGLYRAARRYANRYRGENDDRLTCNGEARFLRAVLPGCRTVFDVGASVGDWAALALAINPALRLHCFEPATAAFARLRDRALPGATCENVGLSSRAGSGTLFVPGPASPIASLHRREGLPETVVAAVVDETVLLETGDAYCERLGIERVDLLKLDVEGHELEVLEGMKRLLAEGRIGIVQFEYGGANIDARVLLKDLWTLLAGAGFAFYKLHPRGPRPVARYRQDDENFQYQNWAAVRSPRSWPGLPG